MSRRATHVPPAEDFRYVRVSPAFAGMLRRRKIANAVRYLVQLLVAGVLVVLASIAAGSVLLVIWVALIASLSVVSGR